MVDKEHPGLLPSDGQSIVGTHEVRRMDGCIYRFELVRLKDSRNVGLGARLMFNRLRVFISRDGSHWESIPLRAGLRSQLRMGFGLLGSWPPENLDSADSLPSILYHDEDDVSLRPMLPFGLDPPSLWKATYDAESGTWDTERVRALRTKEDFATLGRLLP